VAEERDEENAGPEIIIQPDQMAGVWANFAAVSHSPYEFTLDFVRLDFRTQPPSGIVVSRISLSPKFVDELIQALQSNWQKYAEKALPEEVYRDPDSEIQDQGEVAEPEEARADSGDDDDQERKRRAK